MEKQDEQKIEKMIEIYLLDINKKKIGDTPLESFDLTNKKYVDDNQNTVTGNLLPDTTNVYDIGSATMQIKDIYFAGEMYGGRVRKRVGTITTSATPTPNADTQDIFTVTALATAATFAVPSGTPINGQTLIIRIRDNDSAQTLGWNAIYRAIGVNLPTTTGISKTTYVGAIYNNADTKWDCVAAQQET